jgi:DNA polymerase (family 10)
MGEALRPPLDPYEVASRLRELAAYLRLEREPYRARAYERAAALVEGANHFERLLEAGRLESLPGIGAALARAIRELAWTGALPSLDRLRARWSPGFVELLRVPGLGPRSARQLQEALGIEGPRELAEACRAGRVRGLPGFGERRERALLEALAEAPAARRSPSLLHLRARDLVRPLVAHLRADPAVTTVEAGGGLRRWLEIVDAIALAVATADPAATLARFRAHPMVAHLERTDAHHAHGAVASGVPLALHLAGRERFGLALVEATGSAEHWSDLRARAAQRGVALEALHVPDEAAVYSALALPWLPPEVRDGTDELAVADAGGFAEPLVEERDVRGAVHCHTVGSDGKATIAEMAAAAAELGLEYLTITDHSQSARYARGLDLERLRRQWDELDEVQTRTPVRLLKGTEADILEDGALDWPDAVLERLDVVIASIHLRHRQDEEQMTRRLVRAMRAPVFKIWGHPLGRLLLHRPPIACRFDAVLDAIAESPAAIELNGDPHRLDLPPDLARLARARGIRFVLSSDAHSRAGLRAAVGAVHLARRARLTPRDVLNCLPADAFAAAVRPARDR